jgi:hypothetical protein
MKHFFTVLWLMAATLNQMDAQVKIGDNPNTIDANSMLELESTNKGFLPPRVSLVSVNSPTPLTAPVPAGMLVYSSGGSVSDGYYTWSGTNWVAFSTTNKIRDNFVVVKSASDFPAAVGGVITLASGVLYEINGTVTLSDKIDLNGCNIQGADPVNDKLVYTGGSELFIGANGGGLRYLTITAPSGRAFNINCGGANKNLLIQNCYFIGCSNVGTIEGVGGTVFLSTLAFFYNTNGIVFQNDNNVVINSSLWDFTNSNTYEKFIGTFNVIQILGGDRLVNSTNSAIATHISGITTLTLASIKVVMYVGTGTYVSGTFSNKWEVEASGLNTVKDDEAGGNLYITSSIATSFSGANNPTKILGTTNSVSLFRVTSSLNNRLTYTGAKARGFQVICSLSAIASGNNKNFSFYIVKNGVILAESKQLLKCSSSVDRGSVTLSCATNLSPNDYIEVWAENNTDGSNLTIESLNLALR